MNYRDILTIIEIILLAGVMIFILKFILTNFSSRIQKPKAWIAAVKMGEITASLQKVERKYPDKIRLYNIWMQLKRIKEQNIDGDLAELGVYKGDTARIIHLCAPDSQLHLFDTFEGFPADDLVGETGKASGYTTRHFADTSVEKVLENISGNENVHFHKGYFPDTAAGFKDVKFSFVSMDADLAEPTKAGLEFFYPRISQGGVILIHDYNKDWPGLMKAVDSFIEGIAENLIPVPDADSTVMIIKT
jgi:O-methyltransferase